MKAQVFLIILKNLYLMLLLCIIIDLNNAYPKSYVGLAVAVSVSSIVALIFLIVCVILYKRWRLNSQLKILNNLPPLVTQHFRDAIVSSTKGGWKKLNIEPPVWQKELTDPADKKYVMDLFEMLDGDLIGVKQIYAIFNRSLVTQLSLTKQKFSHRAQHDSNLFFAEKWKLQEDDKLRLRMWTKDHFLNRMSDFEWNQNEVVGILPVIHGTSLDIAWKIFSRIC